MWVFIGLAGSVIAHFPTGGHSVRPPHKVEVPVGDRKSLLVDARPCLGFFSFWSRSLGGLESITHNSDPILSANSAMDISFSRMES